VGVRATYGPGQPYSPSPRCRAVAHAEAASVAAGEEEKVTQGVERLGLEQQAAAAVAAARAR